MNERLYLDYKSAAAACSMSVDTIKQAVKRGDLPAFKHRSDNGGRNTKVLFRPEDLRAWVESWDAA